MQNKIIEALEPNLLKDFNSKKEMLEKNEKFIEENELTEDRDTMLELMISKNIVKRLKEEVPKLEEKLKEVRITASSIYSEYREAKEAEKILSSLKKANDSLKIDENYLTKRKIKRGVMHEFTVNEINYNLLRAIEYMEHLVNMNEMNKRRYPKLKGVL